jgi:FK506-binding protein 1
MASEFSREILKQGNGTDKPKKGDTVTMEYTGWLYDASKEDKKGKQ